LGIVRAIGCPNEGNFQWNLIAKTSSWSETTRNLLHKDTHTLVYKNMSPELKILQEIIQETILPKGGGTDQLSLDHKVFLYHLVKLEKVNMPKYIFNHMLWALKESQQIRRRFIPYGRLISEIFNQGKLLQVLKTTRVVSNIQLRTMTGNIMNGRTLRHMQLCSEFIKLETDLHESQVVSHLMTGFPPISKEDNPEVLIHYVNQHFQETGEIINLNSIPETADGESLRVTKKRKSKKSASEATDEPKPKKQKQPRRAPILNVVETTLLSIQEEVVELEPIKVLKPRTRGGTS